MGNSRGRSIKPSRLLKLSTWIRRLRNRRTTFFDRGAGVRSAFIARLLAGKPTGLRFLAPVPEDRNHNQNDRDNPQNHIFGGILFGGHDRSKPHLD